MLISIKDKTKRAWYSIVYLLLNIVIIFGFVVPYLISARDDLFVAIGMIIVLVDVTHLLFFVINLVKSFIKTEKE